MRFLYTKPLSWYLSVSDKRDTIDIMDGDFDAVGWELRKSLLLLKKSNIPALEHLFSPIIYRSEEDTLNELRGIATDCFSPIASMFHYLSMSKKYEEKITEDTVKLKSLFYALRTAMAGKWILECGTMPPVRFREMLPLVTKEIADEIENLMDIKSKNAEKYMHARPEKVCEFISEVITTNGIYAKTLSGGNPDTERINHFLHTAIVS